ncbi:MAG: cupredoxin domain-containing protein [Thermoplasmatota archaeon]
MTLRDRRARRAMPQGGNRTRALSLGLTLALALLALPHVRAAAAAHVFVENFDFRDAATGESVTVVHVGDTVTWTWLSGVHSATAGAGTGSLNPIGGSFDSGIRAAGATFSATFETSGVFAYYCQVHDEMRGAVVVET